MSFRKNYFSSLAVFFVLLISGTQAFCPASPISRTTAQATASPISSTTALEERRWNFNEGQSPWGLKTNAEVWNGRVAQIAFVVIFLQELVQGKGVIQGLQEGNFLNIAMAGLTAVTVVGLTAWLAIQGDDDYVKKDMM